MSTTTSQQQVDMPEQSMHRSHPDPVRIGAGDPVEANKTQLIERITQAMSREVSMTTVIDDIYTIEDAKTLATQGAPPVDRIVGLKTGGCPHTAIREGTSMNEVAIVELVERHPDLEVVFAESEGDNLSATFSPRLVDFSICVIDVTQGEEIPRKTGQGTIKSGLFAVNETDLAPHVDADLAVMEADSKVFRGGKPFCFINLKTDEGLEQVIEWIHHDMLMTGLES